MVAPISNRKRRANRLNASKSTGPRSAQGKATSSRNATSHGIFCQDLVLPGESHEVFHALREAFILQQRPQNVVELLIVDRLVAATWKLRRLQAAEALMHDGCMQDILSHRAEVAENLLDELDDGKEPSQANAELAAEVEKMELPPAAVLAMKLQSPDQVIERLQRYEQRLDYTIHRCLRELRQLRQDAELEAELPASPFLASPSDTGLRPVHECQPAEQLAESQSMGQRPMSQGKGTGVARPDAATAQNEPTAASPAATPATAESKGGVPTEPRAHERAESPDRADSEGGSLQD